MSHSFFFNMEKLTLRVAKSHIDNMCETNYEDFPFLNSNNLLINLENGFVALTQLNCYFESFLNTIINSCIQYDDNILQKCRTDEKIDIIFMYYKKDKTLIKSHHCWEVYQTARNVRNAMIHYKYSYIGDGSNIPNFKLGKVYVGDYFTKSNLIKVYEQHIELCQSIACVLDLTICDNIDIFACDGSNTSTNYVIDKKMFDGESESKENQDS